MTEPLYPGEVCEAEIFVRVVETALAVVPAAGATSITVYDPSRFAVNDWLKIGDGHPLYGPIDLVQVDSISGKVVTLKAGTPLSWGHPIGTPVYQLNNSTLTGKVGRPDGVDDALTINSVSTGRYRTSYTTTANNQGENTMEITSATQVIAVKTVTFHVLTDVT